MAMGRDEQETLRRHPQDLSCRRHEEKNGVKSRKRMQHHYCTEEHTA
jgi:hypothetical protein